MLRTSLEHLNPQFMTSLDRLLVAVTQYLQEDEASCAEVDRGDKAALAAWRDQVVARAEEVVTATEANKAERAMVSVAALALAALCGGAERRMEAERRGSAEVAAAADPSAEGQGQR